MIIITAKVDGFRRAGMAHPARATEHPDGTFTPKQLAQLRAEPMLVVVERPDGPWPPRGDSIDGNPSPQEGFDDEDAKSKKDEDVKPQTEKKDKDKKDKDKKDEGDKAPPKEPETPPAGNGQG